ncbi:MAG TPA: glucose-6-phosphate dehydrogenase, partial [Mycobacterium sp.]|nr:glucose-6-phosphate dehydrogenase [Mycobacterium sp.]
MNDAAAAHGTHQQATGAAPNVIVMFGATGDLARRKLLPGLLHLANSNLAPEIRVIGTSLDELDNDAFRKLARKASAEFCRDEVSDEFMDEFIGNLIYVPQGAGPEALAAAVSEQRNALGGNANLLHYLSVPPAAVMPVMDMLHKADLVRNSRVVME